MQPLIYWAVGDPRLHQLPKYALEVLFYVGDFVRAGGDSLGAFDHTWSLSVEEQFYFVWPVVISGVLAWAAYTKRSVTKMIFALAILSLAWRLVAAHRFGFTRVYFSPDTNAFALLFGCALAAWDRDRVRAIREHSALVWATVIALVACSAFPTINLLTTDQTIIRYGAPLVALLGLALVYVASSSNHWLLTNPILTSFGKISYAWYLWHQTLLTLAPNGHPLTSEGRVVAVFASYVAAWLSWFLVERSTLRLKGRFDRTQVPVTHEALVPVTHEALVPVVVGEVASRD